MGVFSDTGHFRYMDIYIYIVHAISNENPAINMNKGNANSRRIT